MKAVIYIERRIEVDVPDGRVGAAVGRINRALNEAAYVVDPHYRTLRRVHEATDRDRGQLVLRHQHPA